MDAFLAAEQLANRLVLESSARGRHHRSAWPVVPRSAGGCCRPARREFPGAGHTIKQEDLQQVRRACRLKDWMGEPDIVIARLKAVFIGSITVVSHCAAVLSSKCCIRPIVDARQRHHTSEYIFLHTKRSTQPVLLSLSS